MQIKCKDSISNKTISSLVDNQPHLPPKRVALFELKAGRKEIHSFVDLIHELVRDTGWETD